MDFLELVDSLLGFDDPYENYNFIKTLISIISIATSFIVMGLLKVDDIVTMIIGLSLLIMFVVFGWLPTWIIVVIGLFVFALIVIGR